MYIHTGEHLYSGLHHYHRGVDLIKREVHYVRDILSEEYLRLPVDAKVDGYKKQGQPTELYDYTPEQLYHVFTSFVLVNMNYSRRLHNSDTQHYSEAGLCIISFDLLHL